MSKELLTLKVYGEYYAHSIGYYLFKGSAFDDLKSSFEGAQIDLRLFDIEHEWWKSSIINIFTMIFAILGI